MTMLLRVQLEHFAACKPGHPAFEIDSRLADMPELDRIAYRVFPGYERRDPKQQIAVSFSPEELPTERWPMPVSVPVERVDEPILGTAIYRAVDWLGGGTMAADRVRKELLRYNINRQVGTLRYAGRGKEKLRDLKDEDPRRGRIAECLAWALAHSVEPTARLPVAVIRAERAHLVLPMHRTRWQSSAHGCATG
jgi:hypothetical protein